MSHRTCESMLSVHQKCANQCWFANSPQPLDFAVCNVINAIVYFNCTESITKIHKSKNKVELVRTIINWYFHDTLNIIFMLLLSQWWLVTTSANAVFTKNILLCKWICVDTRIALVVGSLPAGCRWWFEKANVFKTTAFLCDNNVLRIDGRCWWWQIR